MESKSLETIALKSSKEKYLCLEMGDTPKWLVLFRCPINIFHPSPSQPSKFNSAIRIKVDKSHSQADLDLFGHHSGIRAHHQLFTNITMRHLRTSKAQKRVGRQRLNCHGEIVRDSRQSTNSKTPKQGQAAEVLPAKEDHEEPRADSVRARRF